MLLPLAIIAALAHQPPESRLCGVVAHGAEARYVVVPDAHDFPRGFALSAGQRLVVTPCRDVLDRRGLPSPAKLKDLLA